MTSVPDRARVRLPGISSRAYEHPADRSALVALRKLTGFDALLTRLASLFSDRSLRLMFLASSVRASNEQFPDLYQLLLDGSAILDLPEVPELFITQDPLPNAMTLGSDKPFIVITTGLVNLLDAEEHRFVIGHELGHVLSGHAVYRTMLYHLTRLAARLAWFAIGYIGLRVIIAGLEEWYRKSELSCDRAGVLASQDPAAARRALMKMAGGVADLRAQPGRVPQAGPRVRRRAGRAGGPAQDAPDAGHDAPVRGGPVRRAGPLGGRGRVRGRSWPATTRAVRTTGRPRCSDEFLAAAKSYQESWNRCEDPFIGLVKGARRPPSAPASRCSGTSSARRGDGGGSGGSDNSARLRRWIAARGRRGARSRARTRAPAGRLVRAWNGPSSPGSRTRRS